MDNTILEDYWIVEKIKETKEYKNYTKKLGKFIIRVIELGEELDDRYYLFTYVPQFGNWNWSRVEKFSVMMFNDDGDMFDIGEG